MRVQKILGSKYSVTDQTRNAFNSRCNDHMYILMVYVQEVTQFTCTCRSNDRLFMVLNE